MKVCALILTFASGAGMAHAGGHAGFSSSDGGEVIDVNPIVSLQVDVTDQAAERMWSLLEEGLVRKTDLPRARVSRLSASSVRCGTSNGGWCRMNDTTQGKEVFLVGKSALELLRLLREAKMEEETAPQLARIEAKSLNCEKSWGSTQQQLQSTVGTVCWVSY